MISTQYTVLQNLGDITQRADLDPLITSYSLSMTVCRNAMFFYSYWLLGPLTKFTTLSSHEQWESGKKIQKAQLIGTHELFGIDVDKQSYSLNWLMKLAERIAL